MSRLVLSVFVMTLLSYPDAKAQQKADDTAKAMIDLQRSMVSIDRNGCIVNKEDEENIIVVCGPDEEAERQALRSERVINEDKIRRGEAVSTVRAAAADKRNCGVIGSGMGCIQLPENWIKGDYSPPYPPDFADVMKGLPDQKQVNSAQDFNPAPPPE